MIIKCGYQSTNKIPMFDYRNANELEHIDILIIKIANNKYFSLFIYLSSEKLLNSNILN